MISKTIGDRGLAYFQTNPYFDNDDDMRIYWNWGRRFSNKPIVKFMLQDECFRIRYDKIVNSGIKRAKLAVS